MQRDQLGSLGLIRLRQRLELEDPRLQRPELEILTAYDGLEIDC